MRSVNCITVNILILTLFYSFARCHYWEKLGKEYKDALYYFFQLHVTLQFSQNEKFTQK